MPLTLTAVPNIGASGRIKQILTAWKTAIDAWSVSTEDSITDGFAVTPTIMIGTGPTTGVQMGKIGDIYVKTDTSKVYVAKGTNKASDWVDLT